jgi:hypothetical protein
MNLEQGKDRTPARKISFWVIIALVIIFIYLIFTA